VTAGYQLWKSAKLAGTAKNP